MLNLVYVIDFACYSEVSIQFLTLEPYVL